MSSARVSETRETRFGIVQIGIILLTLITAGIHFSLLFPDPMFILNGLGYLTLLGAYFLPIPWLQQRRNLVRWAFIGFAAITILSWIAIGDKTWPAGALGYVTKAVEVVLIALLVADR